MCRRPGIFVAVSTLAGVLAVGGFVRWHDGFALSLASVGQIWHAWWAIVADWRYAVCLAALALAELVFPARRDLPRLRVGITQDATWFVFSALLTLTVVAGYLAVLDTGITALTNWWRPDLTGVLGTGGVAFLAFVAGDFCAWCSHWLHHRLPTLWHFHAVHHSQTAMNVLSDNRQHVVETLMNATIMFVPARLLGLDTAQSALLAFASLAIAAFIHANIRTDLGPLRFVLISPQAHRVHHSVERSHYDTNYGAVFACWDYIFGTRHHDRRVYPVTGIEDAAFPMETSARPVALVRTWWAQTCYPFRAISGMRRDRRAEMAPSAP
jgi:sterol desaturase/sphingolipid hydroxylase (fatty acid hydroxylase superfamily)